MVSPASPTFQPGILDPFGPDEGGKGEKTGTTVLQFEF